MLRLKLMVKEVKVSKDMTYKDLVNKINNGNYGVSVYSLGGTIILYIYYSWNKRNNKFSRW